MAKQTKHLPIKNLAISENRTDREEKRAHPKRGALTAKTSKTRYDTGEKKCDQLTITQLINYQLIQSRTSPHLCYKPIKENMGVKHKYQMKQEWGKNMAMF